MTKITGITRHEDSLDRPLSAFADLDHVVGVDEMILDIVAAVEARQLGFLNNSLEVAIIIIFKHFGKVTGRPEFRSIVIDCLICSKGERRTSEEGGFLLMENLLFLILLYNL